MLLGGVEGLRQVWINDERGEVVDQRLIPSRVSRVEDVLGAHLPRNLSLGRNAVENGREQRREPRPDAVLLLQGPVLAASNHSCAQLVISPKDGSERGPRGSSPPINSPAARCLCRSALSAMKVSMMGRINSQGASSNTWKMDLMLQNMRQPDIKRNRRKNEHRDGICGKILGHENEVVQYGTVHGDSEESLRQPSSPSRGASRTSPTRTAS